MPLLICLRNCLSKLLLIKKDGRCSSFFVFWWLPAREPPKTRTSFSVNPGRPPPTAPKPPPPPEIIGAFDDRRDAHSDATPHGAECDVPLWRNMKMYIELPRRPIYDGGEQGVWGWRGVSQAVRGGRPPKFRRSATP